MPKAKYNRRHFGLAIDAVRSPDAPLGKAIGTIGNKCGLHTTYVSPSPLHPINIRFRVPDSDRRQRTHQIEVKVASLKAVLLPDTGTAPPSPSGKLKTVDSHLPISISDRRDGMS